MRDTASQAEHYYDLALEFLFMTRFAAAPGMRETYRMMGQHYLARAGACETGPELPGSVWLAESAMTANAFQSDRRVRSAVPAIGAVVATAERAQAPSLPSPASGGG
jgi:hypothetical protein